MIPFCVISPQTGSAFLLKKGQLLRVTTPESYQVADLFCVNAGNPQEYFSSGRSMDYADTIYLSTGHKLYSNRSSEMLTIVDDSCGVHDLLMPPCSLKMFQIVSGHFEYHPSCHENLSQHMNEFGLAPDQVSTTFNIFMNVKVGEDGRVAIHPPTAKSGDYIVFKAEMDLIVGLTACSHEETNNHSCKPVHYRIENEINAVATAIL